MQTSSNKYTIMSTTSLIDLPMVVASATDPDLAHLPGDNQSPSSALRNTGTPTVPATLPLARLNSQGTSEVSHKSNLSQIQTERLRLQMAEVGTTSELDKAYYNILYAFIHASEKNTGQDAIVEVSALLHNHYPTEYLSSLLDHTLQTDSFRPGLLHLWLYRSPLGYPEPCPDPSFSKPLPPPPRSHFQPVSEHALSVVGSNASIHDDDASSIANFFENVDPPSSDPPAEVPPAERTSDSRVGAGQLQSFLSEILTTSHDSKAEHFILYVVLPAWYSSETPTGHPSSTRRNLTLGGVLDVCPVSSAEVLANARKTSASVLTILTNVLKTPSLYRQQRFILFQELIYRYVQVYCLSRAQGQEHDGALRRAHASVHAFIVPIFDGIPLTHALVQTVLATSGLSSEQQLTKILGGFDLKLRPTLDALCSTFDSLSIELGETFLQLHGPN